VAPPPEPPPDPFGTPPDDFFDCDTGYLGQYFNLPVDHPDVEALLDADEDDGIEPDSLDWWDSDKLVFQRFDPSLDFGNHWWPVDEGLAGDPEYFAVRWTAWIRAVSNTTVELGFGAQDDGWVLIDGERVLELSDSDDFEPAQYSVAIEGGQHQLDVRFAHRRGVDNGFLFRLLAGEAVICEPDFEE